MKRRSFLLTSGSALLSGAALSELQRPVFGLDFELLTTPSADPRNLDSVLVDFDSFRLTPRYVDSSENATITIDISLGNYSNSVSKQVSVSNGQVITKSDLEPEIPISVDSINTDKSSIDGGIVITVDHSSIGTETYNQTFTITDNPLLNGLIAYYPMEKDAGEFIHDASNNNTGNIRNGSDWTSGKIGSSSLNFDGSQDYVDLPVGAGFTLPATVSFWVNKDVVEADRIIGAYDGTSEYLIELHDDNGTWRLLSYNGNDGVQANGSSVSTGVWTHIVGVIDSESVRLYENGNRTAKRSNNISPKQVNNWRIGRNYTSGFHTNSRIDDVRIYDRALSGSEISDLYNVKTTSGEEITEDNIPSDNSGGIAYYKLDNNASGSNVPDLWGGNNGNDETNSGYTDGVYNKAKYFNGSNLIRVSDSTGLRTDYLTLSCWVKADVSNLSDYDTPCGKGTPYIFEQDGTSDDLRCSVEVNNTRHYVFLQNVFDDKWHHILMTYDGELLKGYLDGTLTDSNSSMSGTIDNRSKDFTIGGNPNGSNYLVGQVDDTRIYNNALTSDEVDRLFRLGSYQI